MDDRGAFFLRLPPADHSTASDSQPRLQSHSLAELSGYRSELHCTQTCSPALKLPGNMASVARGGKNVASSSGMALEGVVKQTLEFFTRCARSDHTNLQAPQPIFKACALL